METQDSELVKTSQGVGIEDATEAIPLENETDNSALNTLDALPLTVVEGLVELVQELVV